MKKVIIAAVLAATAVPASAQMTHYLVSQWFANGSQMCRYSNGTVLNMGARICPLSIRG
jgi:hypothetical protein